MGKRDYRHRESKKAKKDSKRTASPVVIASPVAEPEVTGKGRTRREES